MRHQVAGKHLNRTSAHRLALRRNLAASLFEHGTISTTREKAKFVKPFAEKLITLAKDGSLHARRRAIALLQDRDICGIEDGEPVKVSTVIQKLFSEIGPQFRDRNGGYTRIINLPLRRLGDNGQLVLLQLVSEKPAPATPKSALRQDAPAAPAESQTPPVETDSPRDSALEETRDDQESDKDADEKDKKSEE